MEPFLRFGVGESALTRVDGLGSHTILSMTLDMMARPKTQVMSQHTVCPSMTPATPDRVVAVGADDAGRHRASSRKIRDEAITSSAEWTIRGNSLWLRVVLTVPVEVADGDTHTVASLLNVPAKIGMRDVNAQINDGHLHGAVAQAGPGG